MEKQFCINYQPAYSHPIIKACLFLLGIVTVLDIFMFFTTLYRYGYYSPAVFHLAPFGLILILGLKIVIIETADRFFRYHIKFCGLTLFSKQFKKVEIAELGKFTTLIGIDSNDKPHPTFITEKQGIAQIVFSGLSAANQV